MLGINNIALPMPSGLEISYNPHPTGGAMTLLRVVTSWSGLNALGLQQVLASTDGVFTLSVHDPRQGQVRGFQAQLSTCRMIIREPEGLAPKLASLYLVMEEIV